MEEAGTEGDMEEEKEEEKEERKKSLEDGKEDEEEEEMGQGMEEEMGQGMGEEEDQEMKVKSDRAEIYLVVPRALNTEKYFTLQQRAPQNETYLREEDDQVQDRDHEIAQDLDPDQDHEREMYSTKELTAKPHAIARALDRVRARVPTRPRILPLSPPRRTKERQQEMTLQPE